MKTNFLGIFALANILLIFSCAQNKKEIEKTTDAMTEEMVKEPNYDTNDPLTILAAIEHAHGGWGDLWNKNDVQYTYRYHNPTLNKTDLSTERYIFKNEASYGHYTKHEINIMPDVEGEITQIFNGSETKLMVDDQLNTDGQANAVSDFLRRANYFWFVMPYKLNDRGTIVTYEGKEEWDGKVYDKVIVTYDPAITGKEQNDIYELFVNPETKLIDRFKFSLSFLGVEEPVLIANYSYENIDGQLISTKRTYFLPNETGEYPEEPSLIQTMTDVSFNNGFSVENIMQ